MKTDEIGSSPEELSTPSSYVSDSLVLRRLYDERRPFHRRVVDFSLLFFVLPAALLVVSAFDRTLSFQGKPVGILEDYLFLAFAFFMGPLLVLFLRHVISRFMVFLDSVPSFSTVSRDEHLELRRYARQLIVDTGRSRLVVLIKYGAGLVALSSNISSILRREDGWNALAHPTQCGLTLLFLAVLLCTVINNLICKYLLILVAEIRITRKLARENDIVVRPLAPDRAGGMRSLGELALAFTMFLLPFTIIGLAHYFTWPELTVGGVMGLVAFVPLFVVVFFLPLGVVHQVMAEAKRDTQNCLSEKFLAINRDILNDIRSGKSDAELVQRKELIEMLDNLYRRASEMPVWPFNIQTLARFLSIVLGPPAVVLLESALSRLLGSFIK